LLFKGKNIKEEKYLVKGKNRAKGRETREASEDKGTIFL
jgi:hypothetical protein